MPQTLPALSAVAIGITNIVIGIVGVVMASSHGASWGTATIPIWLGLLLAICGVLAGKPNLRMHAMHGAALVALLGLGGTVMGVVNLIKTLAGSYTGPRPTYVFVLQSLVFVTLAAFLVIAINSFIAARKARATGAGFPVVPPR